MINPMTDAGGLKRLGYGGPLVETSTVRWDEGTRTEQDERIVEETPVAIVYNRIPHVVMMATPADLEDFTLGFSLTEELIQSPEDLEHVDVQRYSKGVEIQATVAERCAAVIAERTRRLTGRTGCGICGADSVDAVLKQIHPVPAGPAIPTGAIRRALDALAANQPLNAASGSVHAAAWVGIDGTPRFIREDVGRHNALDKLVGAADGREGEAGRRLRGGDEPRQLRDGPEGDRARRAAARGDLGTDRAGGAGGSGIWTDARGVRARRAAHGVHAPGSDRGRLVVGNSPRRQEGTRDSESIWRDVTFRARRGSERFFLGVERSGATGTTKKN